MPLTRATRDVRQTNMDMIEGIRVRVRGKDRAFRFRPINPLPVNAVLRYGMGDIAGAQSRRTAKVAVPAIIPHAPEIIDRIMIDDRAAQPIPIAPVSLARLQDESRL